MMQQQRHLEGERIQAAAQMQEEEDARGGGREETKEQEATPMMTMSRDLSMGDMYDESEFAYARAQEEMLM